VKYERYIFYTVHIWTRKAAEIEFPGTGKTQQNPEKFIAPKYYFLKMSPPGRERGKGGEGAEVGGRGGRGWGTLDDAGTTGEAQSPRDREKRKLEKSTGQRVRLSRSKRRIQLRRVSHLFSLKIHIRFPSMYYALIRKLIIRNETAGVEIPETEFFDAPYFPSPLPFCLFAKTFCTL
jgi:hypothetical protein